MTSAGYLSKALFVMACIPAVLIAEPVMTAETVTFADGTTCTVVETIDAGKAASTSSSVTAGNGHVSSTTTINGNTDRSRSGTVSSSASSSATAGSGSIDTFSTASITRADGTTITRRSDGTCHFIKPQASEE